MGYRIVVGVDDSPGAQAALEWCARFAPLLGASVTAVGVASAPQPLVPLPTSLVDDMQAVEEQERGALEKSLGEWCAPLRDAGVQYEVVAELGFAPEQLMAVAHRVDADVVVVGRRSGRRVAEAVLGSVPHWLAHHGDRPVVIVPEKTNPRAKR